MTWTPGSPIALTTERYRIRSARPDDVSDAYLSWFGDPDTMQFIGPDMTRWSREEHRAIIASADNRRRMILLVEELGTERPVGWVRVQLDPLHKRAQNSLAIGDLTHRGRGAMEEIGSAVRAFLFSEAGVEKLSYMTYAANERVLAYLSKHPDIVAEAVLKRHDWVPGLGWQDVHVFARFRDPLT